MLLQGHAMQQRVNYKNAGFNEVTHARKKSLLWYACFLCCVNCIHRINSNSKWLVLEEWSKWLMKNSHQKLTFNQTNVVQFATKCRNYVIKSAFACFKLYLQHHRYTEINLNVSSYYICAMIKWYDLNNWFTFPYYMNPPYQFELNLLISYWITVTLIWLLK